jgi:hypothetical protein
MAASSAPVIVILVDLRGGPVSLTARVVSASVRDIELGSPLGAHFMVSTSKGTQVGTIQVLISGWNTVELH